MYSQTLFICFSRGTVKITYRSANRVQGKYLSTTNLLGTETKEMSCINERVVHAGAQRIVLI